MKPFYIFLIALFFASTVLGATYRCGHDDFELEFHSPESVSYSNAFVYGTFEYVPTAQGEFAVFKGVIKDGRGIPIEHKALLVSKMMINGSRIGQSCLVELESVSNLNSLPPMPTAPFRCAQIAR